MTKRTRKAPRAADLPALASFARGYLHEDMDVEYGGAPEAAAAFVRDASADERQRLIEDLETLAHALDGKPASQLARYFSEDLRAAWAPDSIADVRLLIARLKPASTHH